MSKISSGSLTVIDRSKERATQQHFWFNAVSGTLESGAYITNIPIDTFKRGKSGGYALIRSDGLILGNGVNRYMELSDSALKFYKAGTTDPAQGSSIPLTSVAAQLNSTGLEIVSGGIKAGNYNSTATDTDQDFVYLSSQNYGTEVQIGNSSSDKSDWRQIIGNKFGVDKAGNLYAASANIQGKITVTSGSNVYTTDDVNPLNVGSRNLLISMNNTIGVMENVVNDEVGDPIPNSRAILSDTIAVEPDASYTLQYWLPNGLTDTGTNRAGTCQIVWLRLEKGTEDEDDFIEHYVGGYELEYFSENWKYYVLKAPSTATHCRVTFIFPASYHEGVVPSDWVNGTDGYKWQLEKGNVPTDWVIAPEDLSSEKLVQDLFLLTNNGTTTEGANYLYETNIIEDTATIDDNIQETPLSLTVNLLPIQNGEGTPSVDNIRTFVPWTEASVTISRVIPVEDQENSITRTLSLEQDVYSGSVNMMTGVLNVKPYYESYNDEELEGEWISDRDVYVEDTKPSIGARVINIGSSGIDYNLTPQEIEFFDGGSHFQSNGQLAIRYLKSQSAEWTAAPQTPDQYNPFVWWKTQRIYFDNSIVESAPVIFNSIPQSELENIYSRISSQNASISQISDATTILNQQNIDLNSSITQINEQLKAYEQGILIDPDVPIVEVFTNSINAQGQPVRSSVTILSERIEISGSGNSNTVIDSESFRTNKIVTTTLMPRAGSVGQLAFIARTNGHFSLKMVQGT